MCGLFGWIAAAGEVPAPGLVAEATQSLYARGPDSGGYAFHGRVAFGARRLAIIDLTSGDQPVITACGRVAAMQNGEIYNYQDLRRELLAQGHPLCTTGDTEVLAYGYLAWGLDGLLDRLDGMFALAIHDREQGVVHLARDRFGEKPLFYAHVGSELIFSSQLLTVARHPNFDLAINPVALEAYLAMHFVPGEETILSGIRKLSSGYSLTYDLTRSSFSLRRYWQLPLHSSQALLSRAAVARELRERVRVAVGSRLVSDVPVGAFLSGGIDSSIIVACMADMVSDLKTFSVGFQNETLDETRHARAVARHFGTDHHHIDFTLSDFDHLVPDVVAAMDEPIGDQAMLPALWLARLARTKVTVVLSGEGADEIFGGYDYYRDHVLPDDWRATAHAALRPFFQPSETKSVPIAWARGTTRSGFPLLFSEAAIALLLRRGAGRFNDTAWARQFARDYSNICEPLQAACFTDIVTWLPDDLLVKYDKMAMAASLEGRCPYLASSLVEWALQQPAKWKIGGTLSKVILREAFAPVLPAGIGLRPKKGFVLPLAEYFCGRGRELLLDHMRLSIDDEVLRNDALVALVEHELATPQPNGRNLFALLLYKMWLVHAYRAAKFRPIALGNESRVFDVPTGAGTRQIPNRQ